MITKQLSDLAQRVYDRLLPVENRCTKHHALLADGTAVLGHDRNSVKWCIVGAIKHDTPNVSLECQLRNKILVGLREGRFGLSLTMKWDRGSEDQEHILRITKEIADAYAPA